MNEPKRYSMNTGLPVQPTIKQYPLKSREQEFWNFIAKHEESRQNWLNKKYEQQNHSEGDKT